MSKPERTCHMSSSDRTFWSKSEKWNVCLLEKNFYGVFLTVLANHLNFINDDLTFKLPMYFTKLEYFSADHNYQVAF